MRDHQVFKALEAHLGKAKFENFLAVGAEMLKDTTRIRT
jgi:hypothetical protein